MAPVLSPVRLRVCPGLSSIGVLLWGRKCQRELISLKVNNICPLDLLRCTENKVLWEMTSHMCRHFPSSTYLHFHIYGRWLELWSNNLLAV